MRWEGSLELFYDCPMDWTNVEDYFRYRMWSSRRGISVSSDLYYLLAKLPSFWYQKQDAFFLTWSMLKFELLRDVHKFFNNLQFSFYSLSSWEPKSLRLSYRFQNSLLPRSCALPRCARDREVCLRLLISLRCISVSSGKIVYSKIIASTGP